MTEETSNVAEEIQQEADVQPQENEQNEVQSQISQSSEQESNKESFDLKTNFERLRQTKEQLEKENRELKRRYEESQPSQKQAQQEEDDFDIDDDEFVEGKHVKKLLQRVENMFQKKEAETIPDRLKMKYNDFDQVVTPDNVERLKTSEPELYETIISGKNLYNKGVAAYKALKSMGIYKEDTYKETKEQVQKNQSKPVSTQAIKGQGALSDANLFAKGLTPELKRQLQKEMVDAAKGS